MEMLGIAFVCRDCFPTVCAFVYRDCLVSVCVQCYDCVWDVDRRSCVEIVFLPCVLLRIVTLFLACVHSATCVCDVDRCLRIGSKVSMHICMPWL